jgi:AraC-like DNA-binding protein
MFIETVWKTHNLSDGIYTATPDAAWDLILAINPDGSKFVFIAGQATKPSDIPYKANSSSVVISFIPGAYMPAYPGDTMLDSIEMLPNFDDEHFMLAGHTFAFPTYENAEELVDKLVNLRILKLDTIVDVATRSTKKPALSERAIQRHFTRTTGLTHKYLSQIQRAKDAVRMLQQGKKPIDVAMEMGYTDQAHLSKSLKKIMRKKPSDVDDIHKL